MSEEFKIWVKAVEVEARRVLARDDVVWLIGDERDMGPSFDDGMSPEEYVQAQVENID